MPKALVDLRLMLPEQTSAALDAYAVGFGLDKQEIARKILGEWANNFHRANRLYEKSLVANGLQADLPWQETAEDGARRK